MEVTRFDLYLAGGLPEDEAEMPCLVVSPDEMNRHLASVLVVPVTAPGPDYPTRVDYIFQERRGQIALDRLCTVNKTQLGQWLGRADRETQREVLRVLSEMFAE